MFMNLLNVNLILLFFSSVGESIASFTSSKFDLRDYNYVSGIKDQEDTQMCWAFATLDSVESNLLVNNKGSYNFSEAHLELSTQNSLFNSLLPIVRNFNVGGNYLLSSSYFANRFGPVLEDDVPFSLVTDTIAGTKTAILADISNKNVPFVVNDVAYVGSDQGVCSADTISDVKKYLVNNGAIAGYMYFDFLSENARLDDSNNIIDIFSNGPYYYYDGSSYVSFAGTNISSNQMSNHGITIVGWDDSIPASSFSKRPSRDGAWIVKNSYGEQYSLSEQLTFNIGDKGYYYVSYDDINICTVLFGFYNVTNEKEDNVYIHDTAGINFGVIPSSDDIFLANIFTKKSDYSEVLKKVNFYSSGKDLKYDILFSNSDNLSTLSKIASGVTNNAGYVSVDIPSTSINNSKYVLGVRFYNIKNKVVDLYKYSDNLQSSNVIGYSLNVTKGLSYVSVDGSEWTELSDSSGDYYASIRGYTNTLDYVFGVDKTQLNDDANVLDIKYNLNNILDYNGVSHKIYNISDTNYINDLSSKFLISADDLDSSNTISLSLNEDSEAGNYILVSKYKDVSTSVKFSVVDNDGKLILELPKVVTNTDVVSGDKLVVNENPKNDLTNVSNSVSEDSLVNPQTGSEHLIIIIIAVVISFGLVIVFNRKIFNNKI